MNEYSEAVHTPNFHQHFRQQVQLLQGEIVSLDDTTIPQNERKNVSDAILTRLTKLTSELADASGDLPSYDQRSYNQALKDIQDKLAVAQASYAPRPKFSFKSKRLAAASSEVNSGTTTRSATPTYLKEPDDGGLGHKPTPAFAAPSLLSPSVQDNQDSFERVEEGKQIVRDQHRYICPARESTERLQVISDLDSSIVNLEGHSTSATLSTLTLKNISSSFIVAPDVRGPTHMTGLQGSTLILSCHQFRMHDSHNVDVYMFCSSRPIIEDCSNIRFAELPAAFSGEARKSTNMFDQVDDFKWLRSEASPNWKVFKDDENIDEEAWSKVKQALHALNTGSRGQDETKVVQGILALIQSGNRKPE